MMAISSDSFLAASRTHANSIEAQTAIAGLTNGLGAPFIHLRNLPVGDVPPTPTTATSLQKSDQTSEATLLGMAQRLGEPIGYAQEHGGDIVQNLFPLLSSVGRQLSTSSGVELAFHTETAFHPVRPHYLLLLCLRGDANAATTLCSVDDLVRELSTETIDVLRQTWFRCGVDESFGTGSPWFTAPHAVLSTDVHGVHTLRFDGDLTFGLNQPAEAAVAHLNNAIHRARSAVTLAGGDLLIIDNHRSVHGRSPFTARFDGTDRWLQRTFVIDDLGPSAAERHGRVITTSFEIANESSYVRL